MRIVFFNRTYYPGTGATGQLLSELAEDLVSEHGATVTVVTGPVRGLANPVGDTRVTIVRTRGTTFGRGRFFGRVSNYLSYFVSALWAALTLERADIVVAFTDPPIIGLAAFVMAKRTGARFVFVCQDIFPEVATLLTDFKSDTLNEWLERVSRFLVRRADRVVALGESMKARLVEGKGADPDHVTVIHNWADTRAISPAAKDNAFSRKHGLVDRFVVMHSGNLGLSQNLETLIEAAAHLETVRDIVVLLVGEGVRRARLENEVARRGLSNVRFLPHQPKNNLRESFASADVFIVSLKPGLAGCIVPSKLYGILAAGRPYVAAVEPATEISTITRQFDCGLVVAPGDVGGMADAITRLYRDRERAEQLGRNARRASIEFDRRKQISQYHELFRRVLLERDARAHAACEARS